MTFDIWIMLIVAVVSALVGAVCGAIVSARIVSTLCEHFLCVDETSLARFEAHGYSLAVTIDATAPGATHSARGMGSTVAEAVASLRERLGKLDLPRS